MTSTFQRTICVDFDGVVHSYTSGWPGDPAIISDPPVKGAFAWLNRLISYRDDKGDTFKVCIYSSRSKIPGAIEAMREWFLAHGFDELQLGLIEFPTQKPSAYLTVDDRAFLFEGTFPTPQWIIDFKPWTKRTDFLMPEMQLISDVASRPCENDAQSPVQAVCNCLTCRARHLIDRKRDGWATSSK